MASFIPWLLAFFVSVPVLAAPGFPGPDPQLDGDLTVTVDCRPVDTGWVCTFRASDTNPAVVLIRWDFDDDGIPDWPTGGGWTTDWAVTQKSPGPRVCAEVWDGFSTRDEGGTWVPDTDRACTDVVLDTDLRVRPHHIFERSRSPWVYAYLRLPEWADPAELDDGSVTLAGVPAVLEERGNPNRPGPMVFRVDRAALVAALGPGTHTVVLTGLWRDGRFFAADTIVIR